MRAQAFWSPERGRRFSGSTRVAWSTPGSVYRRCLAYLVVRDTSRQVHCIEDNATRVPAYQNAAKRTHLVANVKS